MVVELQQWVVVPFLTMSLQAASIAMVKRTHPDAIARKGIDTTL